MPIGKYPKVKCPTCEKMVDPRGMGAHQKMHRVVDLPPTPAEKAAVRRIATTFASKVGGVNSSLSNDMIMVPISRAYLLSIIHRWLDAGGLSE